MIFRQLLGGGIFTTCISGSVALVSAITGFVGVNTLAYFDERYLEPPGPLPLSAEAAEMGAIGGAILSGASVILGICGLFKAIPEHPCAGPLVTTSAVVAEAFAGGLVGYGIMNAGANSTDLSFTDTVISFAVGIGLMGLQAIPLAYCAFCLCTEAALAQNNYENVRIEVIVEEQEESIQQEQNQSSFSYRFAPG